MTFQKVNVKKDWKGKKSLLVVDVSAVMRTKYVESMSGGEAMFKQKGGGSRFQRTALTYEVDGEEMNTSSMFGLFQLFQMYGTDKDYVFCFDAPNNLLKTIDKNYKKNRVKMGNEYFDQVNTVYKVLEESGFTVMIEEGYEGDHHVHEAVESNYDKYDHIGVITNDHDLSCLVDEKVSWINTLKKRTDITMENYSLVLDCPYNAILLKKCLVGDKSDGIAGVRNFGQVKFMRFFEDEELYGEDIYMNEVSIIEESDNLTDIQKSEALDALKLIIPLSVSTSARVKKNIDELVLRAFLSKYGMKSIVKLWEVRI